jgi:NADH-ubiquinone oxidoreductase chain 4
MSIENLHSQVEVYNIYMLLSSLIIVPLIGIVSITSMDTYKNINTIKTIAFSTSVINFFISLVVLILFNNSTNQFQFIQEHYNVQHFEIFLGVDGISIYFVILTTFIMPIALLSN